MTTKAALLALLALWGVSVGPLPPATADEAALEQSEGSPLKRSFTNRVWTMADGDLPGLVRIFLSDGTLVQDSCWETHRLSRWRMTSDTAVSWDEDGIEIRAEIVSVSATDLVLRVDLAGGRVEERYVAAQVPYVCPEMPKA